MIRYAWIISLIGVGCFALPRHHTAHAQQSSTWPPPSVSEVYQKDAADTNDDESETASIPDRFFTRARGYEKARALQEETGADIFLYISHKSPRSAKGLCNWWENRGMKAGNIQRWLRRYIKVELPLPSDRETRELAEDFRLWEGPTVVIIHPDGFRRSISVFDWPGGQPELKEPDTLLELIAENSSPQYKEYDR